jgi:hypothetical protein
VRRLALSLLVLAMIALGGCGGGDDKKIASKADFIAAADSICRERDASSTKLKAVSTDDDLARLSAGLADIYAKAITELQALSLPPGAARAGADAYVKATLALREPAKQMKTASENLEAAIKTRRTAKVKDAGQQLQISVNTVQSLGEVADASARSYGMRNCGQSGPAAPVS